MIAMKVLLVVIAIRNLGKVAKRVTVLPQTIMYTLIRMIPVSLALMKELGSMDSNEKYGFNCTVI